MDYLNFTFDEDGINKLSEHSLSKDWPITYMLIKNSDLYVGETFRAASRFKTHLKEENKKYKGGTLKNWFIRFLCKLPIIRDFDMCHIKDNSVSHALNKSLKYREEHIL